MNMNIQQKLPVFLSRIDLKNLNYILAGCVILLGLTAMFVLSMPQDAPPAPAHGLSADSEHQYSPPDSDLAPAIIVLPDDAKIDDAAPMDEGQTSPVITPQHQNVALETQMQSFDDWGLECVAVINAEQECHLFQRVLWDDGKEALLAHIVLVQRDGKQAARLRLIAPLGVNLSSGVLLQLGSQESFNVLFQFCIAGGCFVNLDLADDVVEAIKKTDILHATYTQPDGSLGNVEISLKGFEKGLSALKEL